MTRSKQPRLTADVPRVSVNQLYNRGAARVMSVALSAPYAPGVIRAKLTAHEDHVTCVYAGDEHATAALGSSSGTDRLQVEWQRVGEGARRAWFVCGGCRKRRRTLYFVKQGLGPVELVCRACGGFRYPSQDVDPVERLANEISGIHTRLGSHVQADPYYIRRASWPARPKGMHTRTYRQLLTELAAKQEQMEQAILVRVRDMVARESARLTRRL